MLIGWPQRALRENGIIVVCLNEHRVPTLGMCMCGMYAFRFLLHG